MHQSIKTRKTKTHIKEIRKRTLCTVFRYRLTVRIGDFPSLDRGSIPRVGKINMEKKRDGFFGYRSGT